MELCWQSNVSSFQYAIFCCSCQVPSVVSSSVQPHRQQPTRHHHPWGSPGKHTGVGCHFLLQCMKVESESEVAQSYPTLHNPMDCSLPDSSVHGIFQARVLEWVAIAFSTCPSRLEDQPELLSLFHFCVSSALSLCLSPLMFLPPVFFFVTFKVEMEWVRCVHL